MKVLSKWQGDFVLLEPELEAQKEIRLGYTEFYDVLDEILTAKWSKCKNFIFLDYDINFNSNELFKDKLNNIIVYSYNEILEMLVLCYPEEYVLIVDIRRHISNSYSIDAITLSNLNLSGPIISQIRTLLINDLNFD